MALGLSMFVGDNGQLVIEAGDQVSNLHSSCWPRGLAHHPSHSDVWATRRRSMFRAEFSYGRPLQLSNLNSSSNYLAAKSESEPVQLYYLNIQHQSKLQSILHAQAINDIPYFNESLIYFRVPWELIEGKYYSVLGEF